jgi:hypothetical protein
MIQNVEHGKYRTHVSTFFEQAQAHDKQGSEVGQTVV